MKPEEIDAILISLKVSCVAVGLSLPLAIAVAFVLARKNFYFKALLQSAVDLSLVLPPVVTGFLLLNLFSTHSVLGRLLAECGVRLPFTWLGAAVAAAVVSFPLMVRAIRGSIQAVDPKLEQAARSLGAGPTRTFFSITLPLARTGIVAGCLLGFARSMGEFGATIMFAGNRPGETQTVPIAIYTLKEQVGGFERAWPLVIVSVVIAFVAIAFGEQLERNRSRREQN